jgi:hypothetical protein
LPIERDEEGKLRGIVVHRLKDKLGNRAVPTAELEFVGAKAHLLGEVGRGVPVISCLFNLTRWQNAVHCVSSMRRAMSLVQDHASKRSVSGGVLAEKALHLETLAEMELETRAATLLVAHASVLLGKEESNVHSKEEGSILRLLTPLAKLYTAKQNIQVCSEAIECLGGVGFCEDSDLPRLFRDAQVAPVWEGTTNILSLDVWRALNKEKSLGAFLNDIRIRVANSLVNVSIIQTACNEIEKFAAACAKDMKLLESSSREFSYCLARLYIASLFVEHANFTKHVTDIECANRWMKKQMYPNNNVYYAKHQFLSNLLAI